MLPPPGRVPFPAPMPGGPQRMPGIYPSHIIGGDYDRLPGGPGFMGGLPMGLMGPGFSGPQPGFMGPGPGVGPGLGMGGGLDGMGGMGLPGMPPGRPTHPFHARGGLGGHHNGFGGFN